MKVVEVEEEPVFILTFPPVFPFVLFPPVDELLLILKLIFELFV